MKKQRIQMIVLSVVLILCCAGYFAARAYSTKVEEEEQQKEEGEYTALSFEKDELSQLKISGENGTLWLNYDNGDWSFVNDIDAEEAALNGTTEESADADSTEETSTEDSSEAETTEEEENGDSAEADTEASEESTEESTEGSTEESTEDSSTEDSTEDESGYEVNSGTANQILEKLASLSCTNEINSVTDMEQYGLDEPVMTVTLTMTDGTVHTVEVGDLNSMITAYYIRVDDGNTVYTMSTSNYSLFNKVDTDVAQEAD